MLGDRLWSIYKTGLKNGLRRMHPEWSDSRIEVYAKENLTHNDEALGEVLFGDAQRPGVDYRGRGLLHMTWLSTYEEYKNFSRIDVVGNPAIVAEDPIVAVDSSAWFWNSRSINQSADSNNIRSVTRLINPALQGFIQRKSAAKLAFMELNKGSQPCMLNWNSTLTIENGW